jgi:hypothetical protein
MVSACYPAMLLRVCPIRMRVNRTDPRRQFIAGRRTSRLWHRIRRTDQANFLRSFTQGSGCKASSPYRNPIAAFFDDANTAAHCSGNTRPGLRAR